ncbi:MAG: radical SAM protein [Elusimicrobia bacterium]|nr:radical SAM protein [Elusimicrobiota bacterium]
MKGSVAQESLLLIFPPQWSFTAPPASMSLLAGALSQSGFHVDVLDMNIALYDYVLSARVLGPIAERLQREWATIEDPRQNPERFRTLADIVPFAAEIAKRIDRAKRQLRQPASAADVATLRKANAIIDYALGMFSAAYPEHQLDRNRLRFTRDIRALDDASHISGELLPGLIGRFFHRTLQDWSARPPAIIGVSVNSPVQLTTGLLCARIARKLFPRALLTVGGSLLPCVVRDVAELDPLFDHIDAVVYSDGELALQDLFRHIETGLPLVRCRNVISKHAGRIIHGPLGKPSSPDAAVYSFAHLPMDQYLNPGRTLTVVPTRSCRYRCAFCAYNLHLRGGWMEANPRLFARRLMAEADFHGTRLVYFSCSMVTALWADAFAHEVISRQRTLYWSAQARVDPAFTSAVCRRLRRSGCLAIDLGVESLSSSVLSAMHKPVRPLDVPRVIRSFHGAGILPFVFIMRGFPGETLDDWRQTLDGLRDILPMLLGIHFSKFILLRGCPAYLERKRYGIDLQESGVGIVARVRARWPSQGVDEEKEEMLRHFMSSLPTGFVAKGPDIFRSDMPLEMTHCNAHLSRRPFRRHAPVPPKGGGCLIRRLRDPSKQLDEVHVVSLRTGRHLRFPGKAEMLVRCAVHSRSSSHRSIPREAQSILSRIALEVHA